MRAKLPDVSSRWPGWQKLPGIEIAPLAERARAQGSPSFQYSYVWKADDQRYVTCCGWQVDSHGIVSIPWDENWEPLTEDGMLTGFRGKAAGTLEELVQITTVVVPEGEPPWSPSLTARLPAEQIGMFRRGDSIADGIDVQHDEPNAALGVNYYSDDGTMTSVIWGLTRESAASVIALIRERHGEPTGEIVADHDHAETLREESAAAIGAHAVFTCIHEEPVTGQEPCDESG